MPLMTYEMVEAVTFIISCILSVTGLMLLLHHGYKHMNDAPGTLVKQASCAECLFFQILDTSNHETWMLCWSKAITTLVVSGSTTNLHNHHNKNSFFSTSKKIAAK